jgi:Dyp-type peroxidase family
MSGGAGELELAQIQGLILNGYKRHLVARYAIFEVTDPALARAWIRRILPDVQFSEYRRTAIHLPPFTNDVCLNLAFSHSGFEALGLHPTALAGFSLPFQEGMAEPSRARRLGDDGPSDPGAWAWGKPGDRVHGLLALFSRRADGEQELCDLVGSNVQESNGIRIVADLDAATQDAGRREHFGFRDGIANPRLRALARPGASDQIADGEILLGYQNGYDKLPLSPEVPAEGDPEGVLPRAPERPDRKDFGRNGSYLVFRQLTQDVGAFWKYVYEAAGGVPGVESDRDGAAWLASRMVGRWQNGTPITRYPDAPGPDSEDDLNAFLYHERGTFGEGDPFGARCPIGAHIRRTNPRDTALPAPHDVELSGSPEDPRVRDNRLELSALHRILRRGRSYGLPVHPSHDPDKLRDADGGPRGLHFLCFNANLSRQFEFVQSNWALNPSFAGLSGDPDPLLAARRRYPFEADSFTMQGGPGCPTRRVHGLPRVVEVRGGAYFFMPSRAALEYLAGRR